MFHILFLLSLTDETAGYYNYCYECFGYGKQFFELSDFLFPKIQITNCRFSMGFLLESSFLLETTRRFNNFA